MTKYLLTIFLSFTLINANGQEVYRGIEFHEGDWQSTLNKAKSWNKLIFIDFMTEWCGPCLNMAEEVFPQSFIGDFYNAHFVCVKIDAEKGEGIGLAKNYGVVVFPTFVFVDPSDGSAIHKSTSRQSADTFLFTGQSALEPHRRSYYLENAFEEGNTDRNFLVDYINYNASIYKRNEVRRAFDMLMERGGKLSDPDVWALFDLWITGMDNPYFTDLAANYDKWVSVLGKNAVDGKLAKETRNATPEMFAELPDFAGKRLNMRMAELNTYLREKTYDQADVHIKDMISDPAIDQQAFMHDLRFALRSSYWSDETPAGWLKRCVEYLQYIAYNYADRQDASIHMEYALMLERLIRLTPGAAEVFPEAVVGEPENGEKSYSMRSPKLGRKPVRK